MERPKAPNPLGEWLRRFFARFMPDTTLGEDVKAEITSPIDKSVVPFRIACEGTWSNIPDGADLWLVILAEQLIPGTEDETVDIMYPQGSALMRLPGGRWNAAVSVGYDEKSSRGQKHELLLVLTRRGATRQLTKYGHESAARGQWSGMLRLPAGTIVMDSVTLIRD